MITRQVLYTGIFTDKLKINKYKKDDASLFSKHWPISSVFKECALYGSWDPHQTSRIQLLESVQNKGARYVMQDWDRHTSVSQMKLSLGWCTLHEHFPACTLHREVSLGPCCFYFSLTTCQTKSNAISSCLQTTQRYLRQSRMRKTTRISLKIWITWRTGQDCGRWNLFNVRGEM